MRIYTRTGDEGETGLFGGLRVRKDDPRVEAYGTVDELNASIGVARSHALSEEILATLEHVQSDLFALGAELACAPGKHDKLASPRVSSADATRLERAIDAAEAVLPQLQNFVLPAGTPAAAALHVARAVCRRAERRVLAAASPGALRPEIGVYLNRLGDLLFTLARRANHDAGVADVAWRPRA